MAEKISVQIALEGGKQIEQQLAGIGEAGKKAFEDITKAAEQAGGFKNLKPEEVTASLKNLGTIGVEEIGKIQAAVKSAVGFEKLVVGVRAVENGFAAVGRAALAMAPAIAGIATAAGTAFVKLAQQTIAFAESVTKASAEAMKLGLTITQFDRVRLALEQAGIATGAISSGFAKVKSEVDKIGLERVVRNLAELKQAGSGMGWVSDIRQLQELKQEAENFTPAGIAARKALVELGAPIPGTSREDIKELGNEFAKLKGLTGIDFKIDDSAATKLQKIIQALETMPAGAERTAAALQFLGDTLGTKVIQAMDAGGASLTKLKSELGLLTPEAEKTANSLEQSINKMTSAWNRFSSLTLAPTIIRGVDLVTRAIETLNAAVNNFTWSNFVSAGEAAFNLLVAAARNFTVQGVLGQLATALLNIPWDDAKSRGVAAWNAITAATQGAIDKVLEFMRLKPSGPAMAPGGGGSGFARGGRIGGRGTGTSDSNLAWLSRGEYIMPARAVRQPGVLAFLEALRRSGRLPGFAEGGPVDDWLDRWKDLPGSRNIEDRRNDPVRELWEILNNRIGPYLPADEGMHKELGSDIADAIRKAVKAIIDPIFAALSGSLKSIADTIRQAMDDFQSSSGAVISSLSGGMEAIVRPIINLAGEIARTMGDFSIGIVNVINKLGDSMNDVVQNIMNMADNLDKARGAAGGGLLGGRGTGTSDSNLAWVSRGEHIMPARAVRQPGVLAFLEALRRSGGNLRRVLDGMGRFALGGMVPRAIPAFAGGGLGGMSNVTIQFPGLPPISGLRASSDVVDQLHKAAAMAQVRSGGRKPSRYS